MLLLYRNRFPFYFDAQMKSLEKFLYLPADLQALYGNSFALFIRLSWLWVVSKLHIILTPRWVACESRRLFSHWGSGPQTKENERLRFEPNISIQLVYPAPDFRGRVLIGYKGLLK